MNSDIARFKEQFDCSDPKACWVRIGSQHSPWEYDRFYVLGIGMGAHRAAWMMFVGTIPDGKHVCHDCENAPCANPAHLFLGTAAENTQDWIKKGRRKNPNPNPSRRNIYMTDEVYEIALRRAKETDSCRSVSAYLRHLVLEDAKQETATP